MKLFFLLYCLQFMAIAVVAQKKQSQLPPIIDREIFFGNPEIIGAQLSPDGKMISFIKPFNGVRNIWVKKINESFEKAKPITNDIRPISSYFWSRNSKLILYVQDKNGDENYQVYAVIPNERPDPSTSVPISRPLTNKENTRVEIVHVPKTNPDLLIIGLNDRDQSWHDLYELKISTAELKLLNKNTERFTGWIFDQKDKLRLAMRSNIDGSTELLRLDPKSTTSIYSGSILEEFYPINFHNDGVNVYMISNVGIKTDLSQLNLLNVTTGQIKLIESDPKKRVDFGNALFSEVDNSLLMTEYTDDKVRMYWKNKSYAADYKLISKQFKGFEIQFMNTTKDEKLWLIGVSNDTDPGSVYLFDRISKKITFQYKPRPKLPISDLSKMKPINYKSSDGLEISGYLTLPKNIPSKNLPLIVNPHGGPWARDYWGYNSYAQFFANRGYAVLQMNFRSSTGFGKNFINLGNKQWGDLMQDDISEGVRYLIKKGIVDAKRVGIFGGSYGGFATLAGLTFTPDLYACGISVVGPSSLLTLLESIPPYWEAGRKIFHTRMGDPTTTDGAAQLKRQSPLYAVENIIAPLMVVQGANDPRVKKAESDQIVISMRKKKLPVEYLCAMDEGHGFANPDNNMAFLAAAEKFFAKHLGGRFQESISDKLSKKLSELTVNIDSLVMVNTEKEKTEEPKIVYANVARDLSEQIYYYESTTTFLGESHKGYEKIEISSKGSDWIVQSTKELPIGIINDKAKFKGNSLLNFTRDLEFGGQLFQIGYTDHIVNIRKNDNGKKSNYKIAIPESCFADGPIIPIIIACQPLTPDYVRKVINLNLDKGTFEEKIIKVIKMEVFNNQLCFVVEFGSLAEDSPKMQIWVSVSDKPSVPKYVVFDQSLSDEPITYILK